MKSVFEVVNDGFKGVVVVNKKMGKVLDKFFFLKFFLIDYDVMVDYVFLINRVIVMYLFREG